MAAGLLGIFVLSGEERGDSLGAQPLLGYKRRYRAILGLLDPNYTHLFHTLLLSLHASLTCFLRYLPEPYGTIL